MEPPEARMTPPDDPAQTRAAVSGPRNVVAGGIERSTAFVLAYGRSLRSWREAFRSLQDPNYRRYFWANFVSVAGTWMQRVGQDWLVLELTGSAVALGMTLAVQFLPILLGALWAGGIVDRSDLRRVLLMTQLAMALLAVGLAALAGMGLVELWMVWVFAAALGIVETFDNPARHKLISRLVGRGDVPNAVALNSLSYNLGRLIGPSAAGLVIATGGLAVAFAVNAASFVPMLLVLIGLRMAPSSGTATHLPREERGTLRYVLSEPTVRRTLGLMLVVSLFAHNFRVLLPVLVVDRFGGGAGMYGTLLACMGVGALMGGMNAAGAGTPSLRRLIVAGTWFGALVMLIPPTSGLVQLAAVLMLVGATNTFFNVTARSLELLSSDEEYRARVMSVHQIVFVGTTPIGALLLGLIAETVGVTAGFVVSGVVILVAMLASSLLGHRASPELVEA